MSGMTAEKVDPLDELSNPDEWGAPEPSKRRKSEKRRRGVVVSVRLSDDELEEIEARAQRKGVALGTYLRQSALINMASFGTPTIQGSSFGPSRTSVGYPIAGCGWTATRFNDRQNASGSNLEGAKEVASSSGSG